MLCCITWNAVTEFHIPIFVLCVLLNYFQILNNAIVFLLHIFRNSHEQHNLHSSCSTLSLTCVSSSVNPKLATGESVLTAEVIHCLNVIEKHHSYNSSRNCGSLYRKMFPDSAIAAAFACADKKVAYMTTFGIAPYLHQMQLKAINFETNFVLLFDESLNGPLQTKQLDVLVRYWRGEMIASRYHTTYFLGHAKATDMLEKLRDSCSDLQKQSLLQISMDGPNVNWKLYNLFQAEIQKETSMQLLNVGSCGLHIVHNALKAGHTKAKWEADSWTRSLQWLFKDSPARREDLFTITGEYLYF